MTSSEVKLQLRSAEAELAAMDALLAVPVGTEPTRFLINAVFEGLDAESVKPYTPSDTEPGRDLPLRLSLVN